jgi:hypothetical protein
MAAVVTSATEGDITYYFSMCYVGLKPSDLGRATRLGYLFLG